MPKGGARPGAGRPKGTGKPPGSVRKGGVTVQVSQDEWARLAEPYRRTGESNADLLVRLLTERQDLTRRG